MHKAILGPLRPGTRTSVTSAGRKTVGLRFLRPIRMCILVFQVSTFFFFLFGFSLSELQISCLRYILYSARFPPVTRHLPPA